MKIISWNVNGIRAVEKKGFLDWLETTSPDILALGETKASPEQLSDELLSPNGYLSYFASAVKKGYSGVAIYSKIAPKKTQNLGIAEFDDEGRVLIAYFDNFVLINCYFPNSQEKGARLDYKLRFCDAILDKCNELVKAGQNVILCGDYNIAHTEIDLENPKNNEKNPGFLPQERQWMSKFLDSGYCDCFRQKHPNEPKHYTWWSYRFKAREKNVGWRIDYLCVNNGFSKAVKNAKILSDVQGSDHCPVELEI